MITGESSADYDRLIDEMVMENELRFKSLTHQYNAITGEDAPSLGRERLEIPDFAIPVQYVPREMMENALIRKIVECGTIENFLQLPQYQKYTKTQVETKIRRIRHKYDFCFWLFFCIKIKAKGGGRIRFRMNNAQKKVFLECEKLRLSGNPINLCVDKARQWGCSTFFVFYQLWIAMKWDPYHSFVIAAHVQTAAQNILIMLKEAIKEYPAWDILPEDRAGESLTVGSLGSTRNVYVVKDSSENQVMPFLIYIGSAQSPDSLRSSDISGAHYSEVGVWPDTPERRPEDMIANISGGMLKQTSYAMQVMESTAKSADDFFHDSYLAAKNGSSSYTAIFIPWFDIPHDSMPVEDKEEFAQWLYNGRDNDIPVGKWKMPGKYYWWLWEKGATFEGIQWYRHEELNYTARQQMVNEAPSSDMESFISAGNKVFNMYDVERMRRHNKAPVYEGELISDGREGKDVLKNIRFYPKPLGNLKIWEMPDDSPISDRYIVAVDIGGPNPTSDYSSIRVMDRLMLMPEYDGTPNVVAQMHYHTDHDLLAFDAMRLAAWYNNALLVIESNTVEMENKERDTGGDGSEYILDIVSSIYPNQYVRRGNEEDFDSERTLPKWGFRTDRKTKPKIIDFMRTALRDEFWIEPSVNCCDEMEMYIEDRNKFTAPPKKHDDELMATAIMLWVAYNEMPMPKWKDETHRPSRDKRKTISTNTTAVF